MGKLPVHRPEEQRPWANLNVMQGLHVQRESWQGSHMLIQAQLLWIMTVRTYHPLILTRDTMTWRWLWHPPAGTGAPQVDWAPRVLILGEHLHSQSPNIALLGMPEQSNQLQDRQQVEGSLDEFLWISLHCRTTLLHRHFPSRGSPIHCHLRFPTAGTAEALFAHKEKRSIIWLVISYFGSHGYHGYSKAHGIGGVHIHCVHIRHIIALDYFAYTVFHIHRVDIRQPHKQFTKAIQETMFMFIPRRVWLVIVYFVLSWALGLGNHYSSCLISNNWKTHTIGSSY